MKQYKVKANCAIACNSIYIARGDTAIVPEYFIKAVGSDVTVLEEVIDGEVVETETEQVEAADETKAETETEQVEEQADLDLKKMNKTELSQAAKDLGIDPEIADNATKKELIALIEEKAK